MNDVPTKKELLEKIDRIDDEELAHMLAIIAYRENQEELDQLIQSEEYIPPDEKEMRSFQEKFHKQSQRTLHRAKGKLIRWACGIAAAAVFVFAVPISAENTTIFELVAQVLTRYSDISNLDGYTFEKPVDWDCEYYPTWIPSEFYYKGVIFQESLQYLRFESSASEILFVYTIDWPSDYGSVEESENLNTSTIALNGQAIPVYTSEDGFTKTVYIRTEGGTIIIDGKVTNQELERIAQSIANL